MEETNLLPPRYVVVVLSGEVKVFALHTLQTLEEPILFSVSNTSRLGLRSNYVYRGAVGSESLYRGAA